MKAPLSPDYFVRSGRRLGRGVSLFGVLVLLLSSSLLPDAFAWATSVSDVSSGASMTPLLLARVPSSQVVYILGSVKCGESRCLHLRRTTDYAAHFVTVSIPPVSEVPGSLTGSLSRLLFANVNDGYAIEPTGSSTTLFVTTDGATTWRRAALASGLVFGGFAMSATSLYAVTMRCNGLAQTCTDFRLARSSLKASHWAFSPMPNSTRHLDGLVGPVGAYGSSVWVSELLPSGALLAVSHDSGRTFTTIATPALGSVSGCYITPTSTVNLWAECPTGMRVSFFYSGDGGRSWKRINVSQYMGTGGGNFDPVSNGLAYLAYGLDSHDLYRVTDGARRLTVVGKLSCSIVLSLVFIDRSHGLADCVGVGGTTEFLLRTNQGGATWTRVPGY